MKRYREKERGITLVALVITVIIIIILATVTINMAFGDNGLITQAQKAKDMAANSTIAEREGINNLMTEYTNTISEKQVGIIEIPNEKIEMEYKEANVNVGATIAQGDGTLKYEVIEGQNILGVDNTGIISSTGVGQGKIKVSMSATENYLQAEDKIVDIKINKSTAFEYGNIVISSSDNTVDIPNFIGLPEDRGKTSFSISFLDGNEELYGCFSIGQNGIIDIRDTSNFPDNTRCRFNVRIVMENYVDLNLTATYDSGIQAPEPDVP